MKTISKRSCKNITEAFCVSKVWSFVFNLWQIWYDTSKCLCCLEPKMDQSEWFKNSANISVSWKANFLYTKWVILFWNLSLDERECIYYGDSIAARDFAFCILAFHHGVCGLTTTSVREVQYSFFFFFSPRRSASFVLRVCNNQTGNVLFETLLLWLDEKHKERYLYVTDYIAIIPLRYTRARMYFSSKLKMHKL